MVYGLLFMVGLGDGFIVYGLLFIVGLGVKFGGRVLKFMRRNRTIIKGTLKINLLEVPLEED
jgi:hypothetical protein